MRYDRPLFFMKNRVRRVYPGGALFAGFYGDGSTDGMYPEEWIASPVKALNKGSTDPKEGVSRLRESGEYLDDVLKEHADEICGGRPLDVLVKTLDSAVRLPAQAHPDREFSEKYFGSVHGKAESWLILDTRPGACVYFGFRKKMTEEELISVIKRSEPERDAWEAVMNKVPVKPGDVWFVPAKTPHAIGAGCLILETQEPTDFTIQPEYYCADYRLDESEMYLGLSLEEAVKCFDLSAYGDAAVASGRVEPKTLIDSGRFKLEELIGFDRTPCFATFRWTLAAGAKTRFDPGEAPFVCVVTDGGGEIVCGGHTDKLKKGDHFLMPAAAPEATVTAGDGGLTFVVCCPPEAALPPR